MLLCVLQMVRTSRVAPSYRALLEVAFEDVATAEGIFAEMALVGSLTRVCETSVAGHWLAHKITYVAADGASNVSGEDTSCCSEGTRTCPRRSLRRWWAPCLPQELAVRGGLAELRGGPVGRQHGVAQAPGWEAREGAGTATGVACPCPGQARAGGCRCAPRPWASWAPASTPRS